jgi:hypothetical protein
LIQDFEEIWMQNSVNGPSDRTSTIRVLLKGESLTVFKTALEDVRVDPDPNVNALQALTIEHIGRAMDQVSSAVFPHRALEIQKLWMVRGMKKPYELLTRKTAAAIMKINNCLPVFPLGLPASRFTDQEVVGLLEWSLPSTWRKKFNLDGYVHCLPVFQLGLLASKFTNQEVVGLLEWLLPSTWRKKFDLDGYVPTLGTKAKLILECEAIEHNESVDKKERKDNNNNNNNYKKNKFENSAARAQKKERGGNGQFYCKNCGLNRTHVTSKFFF